MSEACGEAIKSTLNCDEVEGIFALAFINAYTHHYEFYEWRTDVPPSDIDKILLERRRSQLRIIEDFRLRPSAF